MIREFFSGRTGIEPGAAMTNTLKLSRFSQSLSRWYMAVGKAVEHQLYWLCLPVAVLVVYADA